MKTQTFLCGLGALLIALALTSVGCGGDDYTGVGAYEGSLELYNATNDPASSPSRLLLAMIRTRSLLAWTRTALSALP